MGTLSAAATRHAADSTVVFFGGLFDLSGTSPDDRMFIGNIRMASN